VYDMKGLVCVQYDHMVNSVFVHSILLIAMSIHRLSLHITPEIVDKCLKLYSIILQAAYCPRVVSLYNIVSSV
jgi:hypothetical protein